MSDKTGWEGRGQQFRDSHWHSRDPSRALGPAKENIYALESLKGDIVWGCWGLKRKSQLIGKSAENGHLLAKIAFQFLKPALRCAIALLIGSHHIILLGEVFMTNDPQFHFKKNIKSLCLAAAFACSLTAPSAIAATETVLYSFKGGSTDGAYPYSGVTMDSHGNLYGTTTAGGSHWVFGGQTGGTVYRLSPLPTGNYLETVLYNFGGTLDGNTPYSGVTIDSLGNLLGTTFRGGQRTDNGIFYRITPGIRWTETGIFSFPAGTAGANPQDLGTVIQGYQGYFYGTSLNGGANSQGNVFKIDEQANETVLYSFNRSDYYRDGTSPTDGVIMDAGGNIYGTTSTGGNGPCSIGCGTVFELVLQENGTYAESILHNFVGGTSDGEVPFGGLSMDLQGNLYGTVTEDGLFGRGIVFELVRLGQGQWQEKIIYNFGENPNDGTAPWGKLIIDHDGNLYGTASGGGMYGDGIAFKLSHTGIGATWTETILHQFGANGDVQSPKDGLFMDASGALYGTGWYGGAHSNGGVFKIVP